MDLGTNCCLNRVSRRKQWSGQCATMTCQDILHTVRVYGCQQAERMRGAHRGECHQPPNSCRFGFRLRVALPSGYSLPPSLGCQTPTSSFSRSAPWTPVALGFVRNGWPAQTPIDMGIESIIIRERPRTKRTLAEGGGSCHPRRSGSHPGVVQQWSLRDDAYGIAVTVAHIVNQRPAAASERPPRPGVLRWQETVARCTVPRVFDEIF
jgi:hypothetical protein